MQEPDFETLYASVRGRLTGLARRFGRAVSADMDAEDIAQEALIAFWKLSQAGYPVRNAEALLVRITKNICISRLRRLHPTGGPAGCEALAGGEEATSATDRLDEETIKRLLYEHLTRTEREYMVLKADYGLTLDEIASRTGKTKPGIKTALSKARRKLEEQLRKLGYDR